MALHPYIEKCLTCGYVFGHFFTTSRAQLRQNDVATDFRNQHQLVSGIYVSPSGERYNSLKKAKAAGYDSCAAFHLFFSRFLFPENLTNGRALA